MDRSKHFTPLRLLDGFLMLLLVRVHITDKGGPRVALERWDQCAVPLTTSVKAPAVWCGRICQVVFHISVVSVIGRDGKQIGKCRPNHTV